MSQIVSELYDLIIFIFACWFTPRMGKEKSVDVETLANYPEQSVKNYENNAKLGRCCFVVSDGEIEDEVKNVLENVGEKV